MLKIFSNLFEPKLEPEAFYAYIGRMPRSIEVSWEKDENYIVGKVSFDGFSFVTQAKNAEEFIDQVNEGVIISNNTPKSYISTLRKSKSYSPSPDVLAKLENATPGARGLWKTSKQKAVYA
jgi:hypothetical protein